MKKYFCLFAVFALALVFTGCGDNKTKEKLIYGTVLDSTGSGLGGTTTTISNAPAPSKSSVVTSLYKISHIGSIFGNLSAPAMVPRVAALFPAISMGTVNSVTGEYSISDVSGMIITNKFTKLMSGVNETVVFKLNVIQDPTSAMTFYGYTSQLISPSTKVTVSLVSVPTTYPIYFPAVWVTLSDVPIDWYPVTSSSTLLAAQMAITSWLGTKVPDNMSTTVTGNISAGAITLSYNTAFPSAGIPTNSNPATMSGTGSIVFTTGETYTIVSNVTIGATSPIGGTQVFSCSATGETGSMTFASDGSISGSISRAGQVVATFAINSSGSGTYTDTATNTTYLLSGAKPS